MIDVKKVREEAEKEVRDEKEKKAKEQIKSKLSQLEAAKKVVRNFERELEDLYATIGDDT